MKASVPVLIITISQSLVLACSGGDEVRSNAQLVQVESTIQRGSSTTIERVELRYTGSQLREVARFENGAPAGSAQLTYGAHGIAQIEYSDLEGDRATEQLVYADARLASARLEVPGVLVEERTITYDARAGAPAEITTRATVQGSSASMRLVRYEYDPSGRMAKQLEIAGGDTETTELRYAQDGRLERASIFEDGAHRETYSFAYVDGRLHEVTDSRSGRHQITYDGDGRIAEIRWSTSTGTTTHRYTYADGHVDAWSFAPDVPVAQLFDLGGAAYDRVSLLHGSIAIPPDLPRAAGGGGGGGGMTCSFEPQGACETCLAQSCCSQTEACFIGTPCDAYYECAAACTTSDCVAVCGETNPAGRNAYEALRTCAQAYCPTACS